MFKLRKPATDSGLTRMLRKLPIKPLTLNEERMIKALTDRAKTICSTQQALSSAKQLIEKDLLRNGYPDYDNHNRRKIEIKSLDFDRICRETQKNG